jgi:hypothetical protein
MGAGRCWGRCWHTESLSSGRATGMALPKERTPCRAGQLEVSNAGLAGDVWRSLPCFATGLDARAEVNGGAWVAPAPPTERRMRAPAERRTSARKEGARPRGGGTALQSPLGQGHPRESPRVSLLAHSAAAGQAV